MKIVIFTVLFIIVLLFNDFVSARPVSYPGGITLMQMNDNDNDKNSLHLHYSPTAKYSIGYRAEYWREEKWQLHALQFNYLVKRWNKPAEQANFYFKSGLGFINNPSNALDNDNQAVGFAGVAFDWETRRLFASYENRIVKPDSGNIDSFFTQQARVGIAPYIGKYGDLHTWLMLQVDHHSKKQDKTLITPLVRFFKDQYLTEFGISEKGDVLFNLIVRF